eukprot:gene6877-30852_t
MICNLRVGCASTRSTVSNGPLSQLMTRGVRSVSSGAFSNGLTQAQSIMNTPIPLGGMMAPRMASPMQRSVSAMAAAAPAATKPEIVQSAHGFNLVTQQFIKEFLVLPCAGAEMISVLNSDENKTFGAVFRTPVDNSFGIPHILEHSVLCGSRKFPIKEPFVELMKGSLNTFLNAFTYPDRTCYPVASTNTKVFDQEGWHLELNSTEEDITYKGVVFNEMKGVYSSPDSVFYRAIQQSLFPDNTYQHDSGGDPTVIPQLTYDQFKDFHAKYYHPSNAKFWFYGDDEPVERLRILDEYLNEFSARTDVDSTIKTQPLKTEPRSVVEYYAAGDAEDGEAKAYAAVNWVLTDEALDVETELALGFLDFLMMGTSASPLRKALNDSGLGSAVVGGGMDDELKQPVFSVGLKGVDPANVPKVEALVLEELEKLKTNGFSASAIEAAINTIEFSLRENNTGSFPRGLSLMLRSMGAWIYDRDPFRPLSWESDLKTFKDKMASGQDVFGPLIDKYLLKNNHRVTMTLLPDNELGAKIEGEEKNRLVSLKKEMVAKDLEAVVAETEGLKLRQETPDTAEALSCMPSLQLTDIPQKIKSIPTAVSKKDDGSTVLTHDLFTNNVIYVEALLDMKPVPQSLLPLIPLFCRSLTQMGTQKESFIDLTERIGCKTGGLSVSPYTTSVRGQEQPLAYVMVRGKAMGDKSGDMFELVCDLLHNARLDDKTRFTQMVQETKAGMEASIVGSGHSYAAKRLSAQRSIAGWMGELMGGYTYLEYIRTLAKRVETDWEGVNKDLETIRSALLSRNGAVVNITADEATMTQADRHVADFLASLPPTSAITATPWAGSLPSINEALTVPTQVNYVGKAANLYQDAGYELSGSAYVIEKYLGTTWLWDKVRVSGGAYGGFCSFDPQSGNMMYLSYRDPNLKDTIAAYDGSPEFLRKLDMNQDELTKAIIGTIGEVDSYQLPDSKGFSALSRYMLGITDGERQARREEILGTTGKDFKAFAEVLECVRGPAGKVVAVTSAEKAKAVNESDPGFWDIKKVL